MYLKSVNFSGVVGFDGIIVNKTKKTSLVECFFLIESMDVYFKLSSYQLMPFSMVTTCRTYLEAGILNMVLLGRKPLSLTSFL